MPLFTYRQTHDYGFAPNPYYGIMTLATCKPRIRRAAQIGDWVVGIAGSTFPRDLQERVVFAMQITGKMTWLEYDAYTRKHLIGKVPDRSKRNPRRAAGDSIYDSVSGRFDLRWSYHFGKPDSLRKDEEGLFVLLSNHFFYFGGEPALLPPKLLKGIVPPREQSHKNDPFVEPFLTWLKRLDIEPCTIVAPPLHAPEDADYAPCSSPPGSKKLPDPTPCR